VEAAPEGPFCLAWPRALQINQGDSGSASALIDRPEIGRILPRHGHPVVKIGPPGGKKLAGRAAYAQRTRR